MHCLQGLGLGVSFPLTPYQAGSSSLSLTVQRALRHTQGPDGLLLGMHRPACVPTPGFGSCETPDCPEPLPDPSLLPWWDLEVWGTRSLLLLSASSAVGAHAGQAGIHPCSAGLSWVLSPQSCLGPLLPTPEAVWESGAVSGLYQSVGSSSGSDTRGWMHGASHLDALSPNCLGVQGGAIPQLPMNKTPGHDADSPSCKTPTSPNPRLF